MSESGLLKPQANTQPLPKKPFPRQRFPAASTRDTPMRSVQVALHAGKRRTKPYLFEGDIQTNAMPMTNGWGPAQHDLNLSMSCSRYLTTPGHITHFALLRSMPTDILYMTIANRFGMDVKVQSSIAKIVNCTLRDSQGYEIPLNPSRDFLESQRRHAGSETLSGLRTLRGGHAEVFMCSLRDLYRILPAGKYTLRVRRELTKGGIVLESNLLEFETDGWEERIHPLPVAE